MYIRNRFKDLEFVQKEFETVCRDFFPRWAKARQWKVRFRDKYNLKMSRCGDLCVGVCDHESKTIYLLSYYISTRYKYIDTNRLMRATGCPRLTPKQAIQSLLIHEICHTVTSKPEGHGKRFQKRILTASKKAKDLNRYRLSETLQFEAKWVLPEKDREDRIIHAALKRNKKYKEIVG